MTKISKRILTAYLLVIVLSAVILTAVGYRGAVTGDDIRDDLRRSSAHVIASEDINGSMVVLFREDGKTKYAQYDRLPVRDLYQRESTGNLEDDDTIVLSRGWHAYITRISETDIAVLSVDRWKGDRTRILMMSILVTSVAVLNVLVAAAVKNHRRNHSFCSFAEIIRTQEYHIIVRSI